jgi:hypothetical protein
VTYPQGLPGISSYFTEDQLAPPTGPSRASPDILLIYPDFKQKLLFVPRVLPWNATFLWLRPSSCFFFLWFPSLRPLGTESGAREGFFFAAL